MDFTKNDMIRHSVSERKWRKIQRWLPEAGTYITALCEYAFHPERLKYKRGTFLNNAVYTMAEEYQVDPNTLIRLFTGYFKYEPVEIYAKIVGAIMEGKPVELEDVAVNAFKKLNEAIENGIELSETEKWAIELVVKQMTSKTVLKRRIKDDTPKPGETDGDDLPI